MNHPRNHGEDIVITDEKTRKSLITSLRFIIFFSVMNGTMFNVAVPDVARDFGLMPSSVSWAVTGFILVFAVGAITYGKLSDIFPVKSLITAGLILMNIGSILGFLSRWFPMLIAARMVQAAGGAAIPALSMMIATKYFPPDKKGGALGAIASTVAFAAGIGPILGGFIAGALHWRYLFLAPLLTLVSIPCFFKLLPDEKREHRRLDIPGGLLTAGSIAFLLFSVTKAMPVLLIPAGLFIGALIFHIRRASDPFIVPAIFSNRLFRSAVIACFLSIGTVFGMMFSVPMMLRKLNLLETADIGLMMFPGAMSAAVLGTYGGRLADRIGSVRVVYMGEALIIAGFILLSTLAGAGKYSVMAALVVSYVGFSFIQSSFAYTVSSSLPRKDLGLGMGMYNLFFFSSGAFGAAICGKLLDAEDAGFVLNPFLINGDGAVFSNAFVYLALTVSAAVAVFAFTFRRGGKQAH